MEKEQGMLIYAAPHDAFAHAKWVLNLYDDRSEDSDNALVLNGYIVSLRNLLLEDYMTKHGLATEDDVPADVVKEYTIRAARMLVKNDIEMFGFDVLEDDGVAMSLQCDLFEKSIDQDFIYKVASTLLNRCIPVTFLTVNVEWMNCSPWKEELEHFALGLPSIKKLLTIGFLFSGNDNEYPNVPSTKERLKALAYLKSSYGFKTFVLIAPEDNDDLLRAQMIIEQAKMHASEIRVGCITPIKEDRYLPFHFLQFVEYLYRQWNKGVNIALLDSVVRQASLLPEEFKTRCLDLLINVMGEERVERILNDTEN